MNRERGGLRGEVAIEMEIGATDGVRVFSGCVCVGENVRLMSILG